MKKIICLYLFTALVTSTLPIYAMATFQEQLQKTHDRMSGLKDSLVHLKTGLQDLAANLSGKQGEGTLPAALQASLKALGYSESDLSAGKPINEIIQKAVNALPEDARYKPTALKEFADTQGFGYKTGNLTQLENVSPAINNIIQILNFTLNTTMYSVAVPQFQGISSQNIQNFLQTKGINIPDAWNQIKTANTGNIATFHTSGFTSAFLTPLKTLREQIEKAFIAEANSAGPDYDFDGIFATAGMKETIAKIAEKKRSMIIRSTGKEDTDKLANAGGNESVPNVSPHPSDILLAMGEVVASYFSEKSYNQRLSGVTSEQEVQELIEEIPFTPVLIQNMIGERITGIRHENIVKFLKSKDASIQIPAGYGKPSTQMKATIKNVINNQMALKQVKINDVPNNSFDETFFTAESEIDLMIRRQGRLGQNIIVQSTNDPNNQQNVTATNDDVLNAIKAVLNEDLDNNRSYLAVKIYPEKSLYAGNLDVSGMSNIQLKMLELEGVAITSCGVMFTEESDGGLSQYDEQRETKAENGDRIATSGITKIDASFGHNEGVVNSIVGVDTYYMHKFNSVYEVIRPKKFRKFPSLQQGTKLEDLDNPNNIVNEPSLSASALQTLKVIADTLEAYYKKPMDVEFVVDHLEGIVYLVQARPITHKKGVVKASYLLNPADTKNVGEMIKGSTIVSAGGAVQLITQKNQVIISDRINEALDPKYLKSDDKNSIKCIIIGKDAPSTSHEATQFRTNGKPVIFTKDINKITALVDAGKPIIVDTQQEFIAEWKGAAKTEAELIAQGLVKQEWAIYPLPLALSVMPDLQGVTQEEYSLLLQKLEIDTTDKRKKFSDTVKEFKEKFSVTVARKYLQAIRDYTDEPTNKLAVLYLFIESIIMDYHKIVSDDQKEDLAILQSYILATIRAIVETLPASGQPDDNDDKKLARRYGLRFLEALLFQQPDNVINPFSIINTLLKQIVPEQQVITQAQTSGKNLESLQVLYLSYIAPLSFTDAVKNSWEAFVNTQLQNATSDQKKQFASIILQLAKANALPGWLHTSFVKAYKTPNTALKTLLNEYAGIQTFLTKLLEQQEKIKLINPENFATDDDKKFKKNWETLQEISTYFTGNDFKTEYATSGDLRKIIAIGIMNQFVDAFDFSIKGLEKRPYKKEKTIDQNNLNGLLRDLTIMLKEYKKILEKWIVLYEAVSSTNFNQACDSAYTTKLEKIQTVLDVTHTEEKALQGGTGFSVSEYQIGSKAQHHKVYPSTLEDVFTTIHQSLVYTMGQLLNKTAVADQTFPIPQFLNDVKEKLELLKYHNSNDMKHFRKIGDLFHSSGSLNGPIGIQLQTNTVVIKYNLPLRSHSAAILVTYKKNPITDLEQCSVSCTISGNNEYDRWRKVVDFGAFLCSLVGISRDNYEFTLKSRETEFTITFNKNQPPLQLKALPYIILGLTEMSYASTSKNDADTTLAEWYESMYSFGTAGTSVYHLETSNIFNTPTKETVSKTIFNLCLPPNNRIHTALAEAVKLMPNIDPNTASTNLDTQKLLCQILANINEGTTTYALNSKLTWFKHDFTDYFGTKSINQLYTDYYLLEPEHFASKKFVNECTDNNIDVNTKIKNDYRSNNKLLTDLYTLGIDNKLNFKQLAQQAPESFILYPKAGKKFKALYDVPGANQNALATAAQTMVNTAFESKKQHLIDQANNIIAFLNTKDITLQVEDPGVIINAITTNPASFVDKESFKDSIAALLTADPANTQYFGQCINYILSNPSLKRIQNLLACTTNASLKEESAFKGAIDGIITALKNAPISDLFLNLQVLPINIILESMKIMDEGKTMTFAGEMLEKAKKSPLQHNLSIGSLQNFTTPAKPATSSSEDEDAFDFV